MPQRERDSGYSRRRDADSTGRPLTPPEGGALVHACRPAFSLILNLLSGGDFGDARTLRTNIGAVFTEMERRARQAGIPAEEILSARFALTAFIDEAIARSDWPGSSEWANNPLSLEYFNTGNAGVEFFDKLDGLRQRPQANPELLEVYYNCMALGFEGKYALVDPRTLQQLVEATARDLEQVRGRAGSLSPNWEPPEEVLGQVRDAIPMWVFAAIAFALIFIIFIVFRQMSNGQADATVDRIESVERKG